MTTLTQRAARWSQPLALFIGSRIAVFGAMWTVSRILPLATGRLVWTWDGEWYLLAMAQGYPDHVPTLNGRVTTSTIAFFPLFPALARGLSEVTGLSHVASAMAVVTVSGAIAAVLLYELVAHYYDDATAGRAVAFFCFFPGSLVLSMVYAEATMFALVFGALLLLARGKYLAAGIVGALATASRPNAIAFVAAAGVHALLLFRAGDRDRFKALAVPVIASTGILAFFAYLWARTDTIDAWFQVERYGWGDYFGPGARLDELREWVNRPGYETAHTVLLASTVFLVIALVALVRFPPPAPLLAFTIVVLVLAMGSHEIGARPRFLWAAFPIFISLARAIRAPAYVAAFVGASAGGLAAYTALLTAGRLATP